MPCVSVLVMSSWLDPLQSLSSSCNKCRHNIKWLPTLKPSQPVWDVNFPVNSYTQIPLPFITVVIQPKKVVLSYRPDMLL